MVTAVFLDRDGVLIEEVGHLSRIDQLNLLPRTPEAVKRLNDRGVPVVVVTNQSVIGRGICSEDQVTKIHSALETMLAGFAARITRFYYCPHHPTEAIGQYLKHCDCRKPEPGMLHRAERELGLNLQRSFMVGDRITDLESGWRVGCRTVLVETGAGLGTLNQLGEAPSQPDYFADGLGSRRTNGASDSSRWHVPAPGCVLRDPDRSAPV